MGEVRKFRGRRSPVDLIAAELTENAAMIRTAVIVARDKNGEVFLRAHGADGSDEDLLVLQRAFQRFVDEVWNGEFEREG